MATVDLSKIKHMSKRCKYAVFGYVRNVQKSLPPTNYYNIPEGIIYVCLLFFGNIYEIDSELTSDNLKYDDNCIECTSKGYNYLFFKEIMISGQYEFRFKMKSVNTAKSNHDFFIGIKEENETKTKVGKFREATTPSFCYVGTYMHSKTQWKDRGQAVVFKNSGTHKNKYGKYLQDNDMITMIVDMDQKELKYVVNDIEYEVAAKFKDGSYRAVIMLYDVGDAIEML